MSSAGFEAAGDEGSVGEVGDVFDVGDGGFAVHVDGHLLAVRLIASHGGVDGELVPINVSGDDGEVSALGGFLFDLGSEGDVGGVGFGDDHESGGFSVEAMDDARSEIAADFGEWSASAQEGVNERGFSEGRGGVGCEASRFVDDEHDIVFIEDFERDIGGGEIVGGGFFGSFEFDFVASAEFVGWFNGFTVHQDGTFFGHFGEF